MALYRAVGYTHQIKFDTLTQFLGWQPADFFTTRDNLRLHINCLRRRVHAGDIKDIIIRKVTTL